MVTSVHWSIKMSSNTERTLNDINRLIGDLESLLKGAAGAAAEQAGEAGEKLSAGLAEARERLEAVEDRVRDGVKHGVRRADRYVRDNPWPAIGIAAAAAFLVGVLISRRN
jgi:ElaB/YqjD/DUF883 family membrane-anchored ribosome-binding protein